MLRFVGLVALSLLTIGLATGVITINFYSMSGVIMVLLLGIVISGLFKK